MKMGNSKSFRAALSLVLMLLAAGFLWAGVPALAAGDMIEVAGQNMKPIAKDLEYATFRNISIHGQFSAIDPDGDAVTFEVSGVPKKGTVQAERDGSFIYTPGENKKGRDTFSYHAIDANGNISNEAKVTISINKQSTKITYADMADNHAHYAALVLAEKGILIGEKLGDNYFFRPDNPVTRGEFLAMCLGLGDTEILEGITRTGFADDSSIPAWTKPYVSTGLMAGIITGFKNDYGQLVFSPQRAITFSEAAVVINNLLNITDVVAVDAMEQTTCPVWSYQAEANLAACNIMPALCDECGRNITRAEAAEMLTAAIEVMKNRNSGSLLLKWAD